MTSPPDELVQAVAEVVFVKPFSEGATQMVQAILDALATIASSPAARAWMLEVLGATEVEPTRGDPLKVCWCKGTAAPTGHWAYTPDRHSPHCDVAVFVLPGGGDR